MRPRSHQCISQCINYRRSTSYFIYEFLDEKADLELRTCNQAHHFNNHRSFCDNLRIKIPRDMAVITITKSESGEWRL